MEILSAIVRPLLSAALGWLPRVYRWAVDDRFGQRVPLTVAARKTYEAARACGSIVADAAERLGPDKSPAGVLNYVAHYVALEVPISGKREPSTRNEPIDPVLARTGTFSDAGSTLRLRDSNNTVFTDLRIARSDLRGVLKKVRRGLTTDTPI